MTSLRIALLWLGVIVFRCLVVELSNGGVDLIVNITYVEVLLAIR